MNWTSMYLNACVYKSWNKMKYAPERILFFVSHVRFNTSAL